jgi:hypothetical protein
MAGIWILIIGVLLCIFGYGQAEVISGFICVAAGVLLVVTKLGLLDPFL